MADALDSKSSDRKVVGVQVPPPVLLVLFWAFRSVILDGQALEIAYSTRLIEAE
jgi:hypothetical protein